MDFPINRGSPMVPLFGNIFTLFTNLITIGTIGKEIGANGKNGNAIGTNPINDTIGRTPNMHYHLDKPTFIFR